MTHAHTPIVYIVLYEDGKFLLTRRKVDAEDNPEFDGLWQIPGGGLEVGEDIKNTVIREAKEELGITIDVKRALAITDIINVGESWHGLRMAFLVKRADDNEPIVVNHESYEHAWFSLEEVERLACMPHTYSFLEYIAYNYRLFKIGTVNIVTKEDKYLLTRMYTPEKEKTHGKWGFMKGTCEIHEKMEEAVVREVKEETNLDVTIVKRLDYTIELYDLKLFCFLTKLKDVNQNVVLNYEASNYGWFNKEEIIAMDVFADTLDIVKHLN
jgi:8-oxo-dGTP pyrophosphatase MutT (NUDIX family)